MQQKERRRSDPVTPMHRRTFDSNGKITNSHGDYPEAVRQVAKEEDVALIDLTDMSKDLYEALGKDGRAFCSRKATARITTHTAHTNLRKRSCNRSAISICRWLNF
jgi:hypothetical protein